VRSTLTVGGGRSPFAFGGSQAFMKDHTNRSFARRWFIGSVAIAGAAGPIVGAVFVSRWLDSHWPDHPLLSFVGWALAISSLVLWPAYVPAYLNRVLLTDAGIEAQSDSGIKRSVHP